MFGPAALTCYGCHLVGHQLRVQLPKIISGDTRLPDVAQALKLLGARSTVARRREQRLPVAPPWAVDARLDGDGWEPGARCPANPVRKSPFQVCLLQCSAGVVRALQLARWHQRGIYSRNVTHGFVLYFSTQCHSLILQ